MSWHVTYVVSLDSTEKDVLEEVISEIEKREDWRFEEMAHRPVVVESSEPRRDSRSERSFVSSFWFTLRKETLPESFPEYLAAKGVGFYIEQPDEELMWFDWEYKESCA